MIIMLVMVPTVCPVKLYTGGHVNRCQVGGLRLTAVAPWYQYTV